MTRSPSIFVPVYAFVFLTGVTNWLFVAGADVASVSKHVSLQLYTRSTGNKGVLIDPGNLSTFTSSDFSKDKITKVLIHGWFDNAQYGYFIPQLRTAYLKEQDVNVITFDWSYYTLVARSVVDPVAQFVAQFLDKLVSELNVPVGSIHVIGFSLGAQLSGIVGEKMTAGKLGRITGLDPVLKTFGAETAGRLDASDAQFVDVIHTCGNKLGYFNSSGHVDFYPNGGVPNQPGCSVDITGVCSHMRAIQLFIETISSRKLVSWKCDSWAKFTSGQCGSNTQVVMGEQADKSSRGNFYLKTAGSSPFGLGN